MQTNKTYLRVWIKHGEVRHDDRNGKCDGQHAGQRAQRSDEHSHVGFRSHVSVSDRGHGHDRPPKSFWNTLEVVLRIRLRDNVYRKSNTTSIQSFVCHGYPSRFTILPATVRRNTPGWRTRRYPRPRRTRVTWAPWPTLWTCVWVFSAPGNVWSAWTTSGCEWLKKIPKFRYCQNDGPAYFGASCPCRNSTWPQSRLCSPEILQNA